MWCPAGWHKPRGSAPPWPRSCLKELVNISVAQLPVAGDVSADVATELVGAGNVDDQVSVTTNVGILDDLGFLIVAGLY
jgi:hypothetical protein